MLIECDGQDRDEDDEEYPEFDSIIAAEVDVTATATLFAMKLEILEILLANGIAMLSARADGSGDEGSLDELHCYTEVTPEQYEECDVPERVEFLVQQLLEAAEESGSVNFNGDGGFWEITITTATRECVVECGWYYTAQDSTTATETL